MGSSISFSILPDELKIYICSFCGVKELGKLSLVSNNISSLVNSNCIWQTLCLREVPSLKTLEDISWKQVYQDEVDYLKYQGNTLGISGTYKINSDSQQNNDMLFANIFSAYVRTDLTTMTVLHLKKIVIRNLKLQCKLKEIDLYAKSTPLQNSDSINSLLDKKILVLFRLVPKNQSEKKEFPQILPAPRKDIRRR